MMEALDFEVVNDSTSCDQIWNNLSSMSRDENQSAQRQDHGLCPVCGQQLFLLKPTMRLGFLALCYGMGNQPSNRVQRIPLTIPQLVERGQCLKCRSRAALLTDSSSAAEEDLSHHESNPTSCPGISITQQQSSTTVLDDGCVAGTHDVGPGGRPVPTPSLEPCLASTNNTDTIHPPPLHPREDASGWHVSPHRPCLPERALSESALLLQQRQQSANPSLRNKWPNEFSFSSTRSLPAGTAIYHGEYNSRGEKHGEGEMTWCNGDVYRGTFVNDVREGYGVLVFASTEPTGIPTVMDGGEYVGNWRNNLMDGSGTRRYPNGDVYVGEYRAGKRQGEGRFYYANGDLYWGQWHNNTMHGPGRYYYSGGQRFEGEFQHGRRSGKGKLQRLDGSMDIFQYVNDERVGKGIRFNADRTKAWLLWTPTHGRVGQGRLHRSSKGTLEKKVIPIAEAVSVMYEIEQACTSARGGI